MKIEDQIKIWAEELNFLQVGIASLDLPPSGQELLVKWVEQGMHAGMGYMHRHLEAKSNPQMVLQGAKSIVVFAAAYSQPYPENPGQIKVARYALNRDYHNILRNKLKKIVSKLSISFPEEEFRICVDSAPLPEREYAQRAGLGWAGKNTMLINSSFGSYFLISSILTTADLAPNEPTVGGCGTCKLCIEACPTGAIIPFEGRFAVDSRECISYYTIEHKGEIPDRISSKMNGWTFGCDICQEVCPFNQERESQPKRAALTPIQEFRARFHPSHEELEKMDESEWDEYSTGTPIRRAGLKGMLRNSKINVESKTQTVR